MVAVRTIAHKLRHKRCKVLAVISQPLSSTEKSIHANLGHNLAYYKLRESFNFFALDFHPNHMQSSPHNIKLIGRRGRRLTDNKNTNFTEKTYIRGYY